ncbi:aminodeoxychorismate lyase [Dictyobacter alpinus]|uniref:Endolytic murein transglycosylase n=1 Tax=Dictyobacter alpinus TaxID=2014873 RepID=A0A402B3U8_9CHLR|nr:endolytic transglycosylase MltG [Dictyobacter alpinus]GCE26016.1 aminodeoxychorismate lyase [Dictyobacter alpinus]
MRRPRSRAALLSILVVGILIFLGVITLWNIGTDIFLKPMGTSKTNVTINIQPGETTAEIGDELQKKGVIRNALAFTLWARIKGLDKKLQAGVYKQINPNMTISDIIDNLQNGRPDEILVLIKEGKRIEEIANIASAANLPNFSKEQFLTYTKNIKKFPDANKYPLLLNGVPEGGSMEGLLFPDSYSISPQANARDLVNRMLTEMTNNITTNHLDQEAKKRNMNVYQFITLASIVEREAGLHDDKTKIASVYWNRLYTANGQTETGGGKLQADPTVQYARDTDEKPTKYWLPLADAGSKIAPNSRWNTYSITGLPPSPISSPGLASLKAAAIPANTNYVYFFTAKDGKTYYAATNQEFQDEMQKHPLQ